MIKILLLLTTLTSILIVANLYSDFARAGNTRTIITGEVLRVGDMPNEKSEWFHRLVKYRVADICEGTYDKKEIIVSHLPDSELDDLEVGTKVCLSVIKTIGPTVKDDWSIDLKGKDDHFINVSSFSKNCACQRENKKAF